MNRRQTKWQPPLAALGATFLVAVAVASVVFGPTRVEAFLSPCKQPTTFQSKGLFSQPSSDADLLKDLPFLPAEVMAKFMAAVGDPLTAGSLQAGYQAGAVSKDDLEEIRQKLPGMDELPQVQSIETIEAHWKASLEGQPWHVQSMGKLATATIVPLVAKMQEKSVSQANAMRWINENALPMLQNNATVVGLLSSSPKAEAEANDTSNNKNSIKLVFNNTRAKFEADRGVWSASMDVFVTGEGSSRPKQQQQQQQQEVSQAGAALQALKQSMGDESISSLDVDVLEDDSFAAPTIQQSTDSTNNKNVGLVNAYFLPDDEIKILVVEIDGILHNVTWKGLD